ncbi:hypothetical protein RGU77_19915 [Actimicrobium sp. CCI2.3]|uniref:hypothetical protein n=1 Tax=Actimicrobium sp. CCI2.3 TaxID=3048616 RepID=UPI002AB3D31A|nr:hypothetical protein [Actimicrobium sp. CCI2.3]MDY7576529.1 hypothetical protein [Actimicrobium sp. CCI2.3]
MSIHTNKRTHDLTIVGLHFDPVISRTESLFDAVDARHPRQTERTAIVRISRVVWCNNRFQTDPGHDLFYVCQKRPTARDTLLLGKFDIRQTDLLRDQYYLVEI